MLTDNHTLIEELLDVTERATTSVQKLRELDEGRLNHKEAAERWSILECIEHLNRYGDYYLPAIQKALLSEKTKNGNPEFKSGVVGNYFANLMKVKNGRIIKMKSPPDKNPAGSKLTAVTIDRFLKQQEMLKSLLLQARYADLAKIKVPISIAKFIKLRLGDTFRFFVYHIERHVIQAQNVLLSLDRH